MTHPPPQSQNTTHTTQTTAIKQAISPSQRGAAQLLLKHFDSLADTPGAAAKLRNFILQLAVRGSLVPQQPDDGGTAGWTIFTAKLAGAGQNGEQPPFQIPLGAGHN